MSDFIPTKRKRTKYVFPKSANEFKQEPIEKTFSFFFQIAMFPNSAGKYHMRKFIVDSNNNFANIEEYYLNRKQCKKFYKIKKQNQYKAYNVNCLDNIQVPTLNDIYTAKSENLSSDNNNLDNMYQTFTNDNKEYMKNNNRYPLQFDINNNIDNGIGRINTLNNFSKF